ncbi:MAG: hypothetical protein WBW48_20195 [Anaerolineae bacterium]
MRARTKVILLLLTLYVLAVPVYITTRFAGGWLELDAAKLTVISQGTYDEATLVPASGAYAYGFAYPSLNVFLAHLGGVPVETLQRSVQPFLVALLIPVSFAAFRALTGDGNVALLSTLFLCLQPEFFFEAVRSSHAKVTWMFALCALFVLARSFRSAHAGWSFVKWASLLYPVAFGLITTNSFFASNYIFGIAFGFLGGQIVRQWWGDNESGSMSHLKRLLYIAISCFILLFLFLFYLYPPALYSVRVLRGIVNQTAAFLLDVEITQSPYAYVGATWPSPATYVLLTLFNWLVLLLSFVAWVRQTKALILRRGRLVPPDLLLWLLYAAFAVLLAVSVILDFAGVLSANLQVRIFPHLMVAAIPLCAGGLVQVLRRAYHGSRVAGRVATASMAVCILIFSGASLVKITNEPLLSNKWLFYSSGEDIAAQWVEKHLHYAQMWIGADGRVSAPVVAYHDWDRVAVESYWGDVGSTTRYFLVSDLLEAWRTRVGFALPNLEGDLRVYDSGQAQLYHTRPKTPYQR